MFPIVCNLAKLAKIHHLHGQSRLKKKSSNSIFSMEWVFPGKCWPESPMISMGTFNLNLWCTVKKNPQNPSIDSDPRKKLHDNRVFSLFQALPTCGFTPSQRRIAHRHTPRHMPSCSRQRLSFTSPKSWPMAWLWAIFSGDIPWKKWPEK